MRRRISDHVRSNVWGIAAMFVALTGTAYAVDGPLPGTNQVGSSDIINSEVRAPDIANGQVRSVDIRDDTLTGGGLHAEDLAANSVSTSEIRSNGVGASQIQDNSIDSGEIVDFSLSNQDVGVLFAEVNLDGTLANSSGGGVTTSNPAGPGSYVVDFARPVSNCTAVATLGFPGTQNVIDGMIDVADAPGNFEGVSVDIANATGASHDLPFRLVVVC
jgi:hypothetical protein